MKDCSCESCQKACGFKPGWFKPGEAEVTAEHLGMSFETFFQLFLMVDWVSDYAKGDVFLLSPAVVGREPGREFPGNPRGKCVFFEDGKCGIHDVKPFECREYIHTESQDDVRKRHKGMSTEGVAATFIQYLSRVATKIAGYLCRCYSAPYVLSPTAVEAGSSCGVADRSFLWGGFTV